MLLNGKILIVPLIVGALCRAALAQDIGVFYLDEPNCKVRKGGTVSSCRKGTMVAEGDVIETSREASTFGIQWIAPPHTRADKVAANRYQAVFARPAGKRSLVSSISNILGFGRKTAHEGQYLVTRGGKKLQLPGRTASLLRGVPVTFSWCSTGGRKFTVSKAQGGAPLFSRDVSGLSSLIVTPEALGLKAEELYVWTVTGTAEVTGQLMLMSKESAAEVADGLQEIEKSDISDLEKRMRKAAFLEFMSDSYPDELNLYWRAHELLSSLGEGGADKELVKTLRLAADKKLSCEQE